MTPFWFGVLIGASGVAALVVLIGLWAMFAPFNTQETS